MSSSVGLSAAGYFDAMMFYRGNCEPAVVGGSSSTNNFPSIHHPPSRSIVVGQCILFLVGLQCREQHNDSLVYSARTKECRPRQKA
jgi:hypothetical protein